MVIQSKKDWLADQFVPAAIEVNDGRITAILPYGTKDVDDDYGDKRIVPGFMDIHCHGAYEFDTNDANEDGLRYWAEHIVSEGVIGSVKSPYVKVFLQFEWYVVLRREVNMFLYITLICRSFKYMYVRIQVMSVGWIAGTVLANVYFCPPVSFIVRHPEAENPW